MNEMPSAERMADSARRYDQIAPEMGFREYWYPACLASEVSERPLAISMLGSPVLLVRRGEKIYALADECPHRGVRLSQGSCAFPGTNTITCRYHSWTFDVTNGNCVAALFDGPDSPMVNKVRVRTYPLSEFQGIVWIWMGRGKPVAPEEDVPLQLRNAAIVRVVRREAYGNWRWHIENPGLGHLMVHLGSAYVRMKDFPGVIRDIRAELVNEEDGSWLCEDIGGALPRAAFAGLGTWPRARLGAGIFHERWDPLAGVKTKVSLRLPAVTRVTHFPINGALYYEWYVQTDPDHYNYFQVCCGYPQGWLEHVSFLTRYYGWGRWAGMVQFNSQDLWGVADCHDYFKRHGEWIAPVRHYRPDTLQLAWRDYAVNYARGVGLATVGGAAPTPLRKAQ